MTITNLGTDLYLMTDNRTALQNVKSIRELEELLAYTKPLN